MVPVTHITHEDMLIKLELNCRRYAKLLRLGFVYFVKRNALFDYAGRELSPGPVLTLRNVSRDQAGAYKCVASNYVPGSVTAEANVTVHYPPGRVTVARTRDALQCSAEGSGFPAPRYTWVFPNGEPYRFSSRDMV